MKRTKLILFTSRGGGGHLSACDAFTGYFSGRYDITAVNPFDDILSGLDPLRKLSRNRLSGEDAYNFFIRHGWYRLINFYAYTLGASLITARLPRILQLIRAYLDREKPDLVISIIPFLNAPIAGAAQSLGIPCAVVMVDLDPSTYVLGMNGSRYENLVFTIPCDLPPVKKTIAAAGIPQERIHVAGFPVRPAFITPVEAAAVKRTFGLSPDLPLILLLMGANGTKRACRFARLIEAIAVPAELVIVTGHNQRLTERLAGMPAAAHVKRRVIGYTPRIGELMGAADLLVTKSGASTIF